MELKRLLSPSCEGRRPAVPSEERTSSQHLASQQLAFALPLRFLPLLSVACSLSLWLRPVSLQHLTFAYVTSPFSMTAWCTTRYFHFYPFGGHHFSIWAKVSSAHFMHNTLRLFNLSQLFWLQRWVFYITIKTLAWRNPTNNLSVFNLEQLTTVEDRRDERERDNGGR